MQQVNNLYHLLDLLKNSKGNRLCIKHDDIIEEDNILFYYLEEEPESENTNEIIRLIIKTHRDREIVLFNSDINNIKIDEINKETAIILDEETYILLNKNIK